MKPSQGFSHGPEHRRFGWLRFSLLCRKKRMASSVVPVGQSLAYSIFQTCRRSSAGSGLNCMKESGNS